MGCSWSDAPITTKKSQSTEMAHDPTTELNAEVAAATNPAQQPTAHVAVEAQPMSGRNEDLDSEKDSVTLDDAAVDLDPSIQSDGYVSANFIRDYPELVDGVPSHESSISSTFMTLVPGDGPTSQQMWAQLGADVMMEIARRQQAVLEQSTLSQI